MADMHRVDEWPTPGEMLLASIQVTALGLALVDLLLVLFGD